MILVKDILISSEEDILAEASLHGGLEEAVDVHVVSLQDTSHLLAEEKSRGLFTGPGEPVFLVLHSITLADLSAGHTNQVGVVVCVHDIQLPVALAGLFSLSSVSGSSVS